MTSIHCSACVWGDGEVRGGAVMRHSYDEYCDADWKDAATDEGAVALGEAVAVPVKGTYLVVDGVVRRAAEEFGHGGRLYTTELER